ncbi:bifunctional aldolase/short-chain dehydrogenase [Actinotalea sp.]|uniref:bifunctional aldolase/short-chain dehydrogenase n=1 Tax=Actinotalea sp. TaxID=1872145 RepID=UPI0035660D82
MDNDAQIPSPLLDELVAATREIGADPRLVLHGGGNSSLKATVTDVTGREITVLFVKGSGHDMATIGADGFAPMRLDRLRELLPPVRMSDRRLRNELRCAVLDSDAPDPSVETLVHALLPQAAVLHSHADVVLALTNTPEGPRHVREAYGDRVVVVDYAMPGPDLAEACQRAWAEQSTPATEGLVVLHHGLFAVGDTPAQALERHRSLIDAAEAHLAAAPARALPQVPEAPPADPVAVARLRKRLSDAAGFPVVLRRSSDTTARAMLADPALRATLERGPLTPDHVIWTKRTPLIGDDVEGYVREYAAYVDANAARRGAELVMLDPAPRVVLDEELGLLTCGRSARESAIAEDLYRHTLATILDSERLGGYAALSADHVFDLEYWTLQQDKLLRSAPRGSLAGTVAVVTGAASGIGRACAAELLACGASVVGWDRDAAVATTFDGPEWLGLQVDVTDEEDVTAALAAGVDAFGGLDVLVVAAGIFPGAQHLGELPMSTWRKVMAVNVDSVAYLFGEAHPLLAAAPGGGRVVIIASKNVPAPGPGAAAYSSSKAALTQLSRVAALEWAPDGIRVNLVHPDAVFDTGLWTPELLAARAEHYGMSVDDYKRRNLLRAEVTSVDVARLARSMADDTFRCTTGAQVPIDGGNERVI